jgi:hypothetical protein
MKKLVFLLMLIPIFFGCEYIEDFVVYEEISEVHLTGGAWTFVDYDIQVISSISDVEVIYNDTVCISAFGNQSYVSGGILMEQHYDLTSPDRRFIKGKTKWEFDDNSYTLYIDGNVDVRYPVTYPNYMMKEYDKMVVSNPFVGTVTNYSFETNAQGVNYSTKLILLSPEIVSDLYLSNGMRDKAVTVRIVLTFMR